MQTENPAAQAIPGAEPLNENLAVRCSATEKRAVKIVALARGTSESALMRERSNLAEIVAEAERIRARLAEAADADNAA